MSRATRKAYKAGLRRGRRSRGRRRFMSSRVPLRQRLGRRK